MTKLLITLEPKEEYGYQNASIITDQGLLIDKYLDDGEAEEIKLDGVLDFLQGRKLEGLVSGLTKKLKIGGKLTFLFTDIYTCCREYTFQRITWDQLNDLIHGNKGGPKKEMAIGLHDLATHLQSIGLKIVLKRLNGFQAIVSAER